MQALLDWLITLPSLAKLVTVFGVMLVLVRFKVNIGWALCLGGVLCGVWFGQGPAAIGGSILAALGRGEYITLLCIIMLILVLNHTMRQSGQTRRIVDAFLRVSNNPRTTLIFFPALLGLLPMPGGALFSAPMVQATGEPLGVGNREKTLVNYWFRHIWEYSWPLYPGVVLAASYSRYGVGEICLYQLPLVFVVVLVGYLAFIRGLRIDPPSAAREGNANRRRAVLRFLREVTPIWLVVVMYAAFAVARWITEAFAPDDSAWHETITRLPDTVGLVLAILVTTVTMWVKARMSLRAIGRVIWQKDMLGNLIIALGIIVFAGVLEGSGAAEQVAGELNEYAVPIWLVAVILPFTVGAITGITMNMVALTYPVILSALTEIGQQEVAIGYMALAFACGYGGILITPVHICMAQSNRYFKLRATSTMSNLALPVLALMAAGGGLFLLYTRGLPALGW